jgi:hypothetical protein
MVLLFVQIITINSEQKFLKNIDKRTKTREEYLDLICGDNNEYCKRHLQDLFVKRKNLFN